MAADADPSAAYEALRELSARYAAGLDRRREDILTSVFSSDGSLVVYRPAHSGAREAQRFRGHAEIARVVRTVGEYTATFHFLGQSRYEVQGQRASGEVYCVAHHYRRSGDERTDFVMFIRYEDEYRVEDGGWRIDRRDVRTVWTETRGWHAAAPGW